MSSWGDVERRITRSALQDREEDKKDDDLNRGLFIAGLSARNIITTHSPN